MNVRLREDAVGRAQDERGAGDARRVGGQPLAPEVRQLLHDGRLRGLAAHRARGQGLHVVAEVLLERLVPPREHRQHPHEAEEHLHGLELDAEAVHRGRDRVHDLRPHVHAAVHQHELRHALRPVRGESRDDRRAKRVAHDDGPRQPEVVEQGGQVVAVLGQAVAGVGLVAVAAAAEVVGDHAMPRRQEARPGVPAQVVGAEPVHADDGGPAARPLLDGQDDAVDVDTLHGSSPQALSANRRFRAAPCAATHSRVDV